MSYSTVRRDFYLGDDIDDLPRGVFLVCPSGNYAILVNLTLCWKLNFSEYADFTDNLDAFIEQFEHTVIHEEIHKTIHEFGEGENDGLDYIEGVLKEAIL